MSTKRILLAVSCLLCLITSARAVSFQKPKAFPGSSTDGRDADENPSIATDGQGHWVAVWSNADINSFGSADDANIAVSRSTDNGATWTAPARLNSLAVGETPQVPVFEGVPSLATDGNGTWLCAFIGGENRVVKLVTYKQIQVCKSTDNGATWSDPVAVNPDDPSSYTLGRPSIASDGAGHWVLVWESSALASNPGIGDSDIVVSTSTNGTTWSDYAMLNSEGETDSPTTGALDIEPVVASDKNGVWVCAWNSDFKRGIDGQGDREIVFARSTDNGTTWSDQAVLNGEFDTETGLDERAALAADGDGNWILTWDGYTDLSSRYRIWTCASTDDGQSWTQRLQVSENPPEDDQSNPKVITDGNGKWIVVWNGTLLLSTASDFDIGISESTNIGATWSAVKAVNTDAADDGLRYDSDPAIATDTAGHWAVIWETNDPENGDLDIWRAISKEAGGGNPLAIVAPNGGEKWKQNKKYKIKWEPGDAGATIKLELLRNGAVVDTIKGSTPNDGKLKWKVPSSLSTGGGYKVRATSKSDGSIKDSSDGNFNVKAAK
ncbi:MAG: exo-alpha-sialidase [Candidatus Hydrogenedentes bacterium]|nr:exo-alpha-sialidase [Candidatus Hydrogenedentota bacterium]